MSDNAPVFAPILKTILCPPAPPVAAQISVCPVFFISVSCEPVFNRCISRSLLDSVLSQVLVVSSFFELS